MSTPRKSTPQAPEKPVPPSSEERRAAYRLAAAADCDPRTALRALRLGPRALHGFESQRRVAQALNAPDFEAFRAGPDSAA
jgi:hypothetical protein